MNNKADSFVKVTALVSLWLTVIYLLGSLTAIAFQGALAPALLSAPKNLDFALPLSKLIDIVALGAVNLGFCISALKQNGKKASVVGFIVPVAVFVLLALASPLLARAEAIAISARGVNAIAATASLNALLSYVAPLISTATILTASVGAARYIKDSDSSSHTEDANI